MEHVAIDLGGKESQICVRSADGAVVREVRWPTRKLGEFLAERPPSRVVVETCSEAFGVADQARELGHEVRVVPATLVKTLGIGARRTKNDRRDAQVLSEVSCRIDLPTVHVPSADARRRKTTCGMREALVSARTQLINTVRGWLRATSRRPRAGASHTFADRIRELLADETVPSFVERQLSAIEALSEQIAAADEELEKEATSDPVCRRLMTVPGVGPVTSMRFLAAVDDVRRFKSSHALESYLGLVPGESSSSERQQRLSITKAGPRAVRWALVQAAWVALRTCRRPGAAPLQLWAKEIEKRRGKRIAIVALARKLAGILYAVWKSATDYDPQRLIRT